MAYWMQAKPRKPQKMNKNGKNKDRGSNAKKPPSTKRFSNPISKNG